MIVLDGAIPLELISFNILRKPLMQGIRILRDERSLTHLILGSFLDPDMSSASPVAIGDLEALFLI